MRHELLGRLRSLDDAASFVLVAGPVGYGKTTLARQWCASHGGPTAWVQVTREHRDPGPLVRDLEFALLVLAPTHGSAARLISERGPASPDAAAQLARAVDAIGGRLLLVLDDLHQARSAASLALIANVAELLPPGSRIVATANRRPRIPALTLHREGRWAELGVEDLRFTTEEVASLLRQAGVISPDEAAVEVMRRTEGWAAGVRFAAEMVAGAPDAVAAAARVSGDHDAFADYLRTQVLGGLSVETLRFLMRTSVLPRLSGALCDAALDAVGSAAWLAEIGTLGLPLVPLDDRGEWFRYSRLFREMLAAELRRREAGEDTRVLRRACAWFEVHGFVEESLECAVAVGDEYVVARLLAAHTQVLNSRGRIGLARHWLDLLSDHALERFPALAAMAVWIWALTGDAARALAALRIAEENRFDDLMVDGSSSLESAIVRGRAALAPDGLEAMLRDAERAVRLEPPGSPWHTMAALLLGSAQRLTGATREAVRSFELAARYGGPQQSPGASFALAQHALLAADREDWATAEACTVEAAELVRSAGLEAYGPAVLVYVAAARVALHHNDLVTVHAQVSHALELYADPSPVAFPWLATQAAVELGRLALTLGDVDAARSRLTEARRHLTVLPDAGLLTEWVEGLADDLLRAHDVGEAHDAFLLTRAELRVLAKLPTHLSLAQIADELVLSRNTVKTQVAAIYRKLEATNRADAVQRARGAGLLDLPELRPPP